jgi:2-methylcitrate dehydratase PrpD
LTANLTVEGQLAEWATDADWDDLPPHVQQFVREFLLDSFGSALAGVAVAEVESVRSAAQRLAGRGDCSVVGGGSASLYGATMVNAYLDTAATICDVHRETQCHVGPSVVPAALATAEVNNSSGRDLLTAVAVGLEITTRIAMSLRPTLSRARGWHAPGVAGPFGAAAACGRLLGFGVPEMVTALSLASSQASGTYSQWMTPGVKFHQTHGALAGLLASQLAASGLQASPMFLENSDGGFLRVYSDGGDVAQLGGDLGQRFELERISLRRWPGGSYVQSVITAILGLLKEGVSAERLRRLTVRMSPPAFAMHGEQEWSEPFTARLSARYIAAVILLDQTCWLEQFTVERIGSADVDRIAKHVVHVEADTKLFDAAVRVEADLDSGERTVIEVDEPYGDPSRRLSVEDLQEKFRLGSAAALGEARSAAALEMLVGAPGWRSVELGTAMRAKN